MIIFRSQYRYSFPANDPIVLSSLDMSSRAMESESNRILGQWSLAINRILDYIFHGELSLESIRVDLTIDELIFANANYGIDKIDDGAIVFSDSPVVMRFVMVKDYDDYDIFKYKYNHNYVITLFLGDKFDTENDQEMIQLIADLADCYLMNSYPITDLNYALNTLSYDRVKYEALIFEDFNLLSVDEVKFVFCYYVLYFYMLFISGLQNALDRTNADLAVPVVAPYEAEHMQAIFDYAMHLFDDNKPKIDITPDDDAINIITKIYMNNLESNKL